MKSDISIPEAETLRRIAAALATSLSRSARFEGRIDVGMSAGLFFRGFPWTGEIACETALPDFAASTAGQYFLAFNWEGKPVVQASAAHAAAPPPAAPLPPPPALDSLFDAIFDEKGAF